MPGPGMFGNMGDNANAVWQALTRNYQVLPDMDLLGEDPGFLRAMLQGGYDTAQDLTTINPAMDAAGAALGFGLAKGAGPLARKFPRAAEALTSPVSQLFRRGADDVGQYIPPSMIGSTEGQAAFSPATPHPQASMPASPYVGGRGGLAGQEMASGHPTYVPRSPADASDFAAMDRLGPLEGPDLNPRWFEHEDMLNGADPDWYARPTEYLQDDFSDALRPGSGWDPTESGSITGDERFDNLILQTMQEYLAMGADEQTALEAALLQFSDKFGL